MYKLNTVNLTSSIHDGGYLPKKIDHSMKKTLILILFVLSLEPTYAKDSSSVGEKPSWLNRTSKRLHQIWTEGDNEAYLTLYAWHNRYAYTPEKMQETTYNEKAWGGGFGKSFYDEDGDWHGLYAIAFLDSHKNVEPIVGYAFLKTAPLTANTQVGAGYSILLTMRPDIFGGFPFPGAAPWLSFTYKKATLAAAYVPGGQNVGNVAFIFAKWTL